jgi:hypothetical protein
MLSIHIFLVLRELKLMRVRRKDMIVHIIQELLIDHWSKGRRERGLLIMILIKVIKHVAFIMNGVVVVHDR